jgi:TPP-dependent pyruvate/acetoin dehydrogenase alpha subunit
MNQQPDKEILTAFYRKICLIRKFGEAGMEMYRKGFIRGYYHSYLGQEAVAAGACQALRPDDYVVSTHRGHGHLLAKGMDPKRMMAELFGRAGGCSHGRGGSMHMQDMSTGNIGTTGIVGSGIPLAAGVAMGIRQEKSDRVTVCFLGDGAANNGVFSETLNLAAVYKLPLIFVLENNCYAASTPASQTTRCEHFSDRAKGFGLPGETVFGNDPVEVYISVQRAVNRARRGNGPSLIEAETYRRLGHHINDPGDYMPEEEQEIWRARDPLDISRNHLFEAGMSTGEIEEIDRTVESEIAEAVAFAAASPEPDVQEFLEDIAGYDE